MQRTTVVIATRDRPAELAHTLGVLRAHAPRVPIVVVDNDSADDPSPWITGRHPGVHVIRLDTNRGACARTVGARRADTEFVAFCDDDSTWDSGAFSTAERLFDGHPTLGAVVGRTLVGEWARPDPIVADLAASPLRDVDGLPGPRVLGFLACALIVRRDAYLGVGGFSPVLHFAGEERLLALDLSAHGWNVCYVDTLIARHRPSAVRPPTDWRRRREMRNDALTDWMRRPLAIALAVSARLVRRALSDRVARGAVADLVRVLPSALAQRRRLPASLEHQVRLVEAARGTVLREATR